MCGRDPDVCKILFTTAIVLGETRRGAEEKKQRLNDVTIVNLDAKLAYMSVFSGIAFSRFDLDAPLGKVKTNASRSLIANFTTGTAKTTLREIASDTRSGGIDFAGNPDGVAAEMDEVMRRVGGDCFLITDTPTRRTMAEITEILAPALQRRGLSHTRYDGLLFRDKLLPF